MTMKKKNNYPKGQGIRNFTTYELESVRFIMRLFSEREGLGDGDTLVNYIHAKLCEHGLEDLNLRESGKYVVNRYVINDFLGAAESRPNKVVIDLFKKFIGLEETLKGYEKWFHRPDDLIACGDNILKVATDKHYKEIYDDFRESDLFPVSLAIKLYRSGESTIFYCRTIPSTTYKEVLIIHFEYMEILGDLFPLLDKRSDDLLAAYKASVRLVRPL